MRYMQKQGHEVVFISPEDEYVSKMKEAIQAPYFPLQHMSRKGYNPWVDMKLVGELRRIFKEQRIDLVFTYTIKPNVYAALAIKGTATKLVSNITGLGFVFLKQSIGNSIAKVLLRNCMRSSSRVVFQNNSDRNLFISKKYLSEDKTILINGSGINLDRYQPRIKDPSKPFTFLFIGRLLYDKGIRELIEAAYQFSKLHTQVRFHLVGSLDEGNPSAVSEDQLKGWLQNNQQLHYFGHQQEVIPFLKEADVVVLPSYREGIPRVLLEAMAMQIPFITTDTAGCRDVTVPEKNGFLVPIGDHQLLYEAMLRMYQLPEEQRIEMGVFGRKLALEKYDEKIIVQDYLKLILSLTDQ